MARSTYRVSVTVTFQLDLDAEDQYAADLIAEQITHRVFEDKFARAEDVDIRTFNVRVWKPVLEVD